MMIVRQGTHAIQKATRNIRVNNQFSSSLSTLSSNDGRRSLSSSVIMPPSSDIITPPPMLIPQEIMQRIPKAELHRHLDGSLRLETILDLANRQNLSFPAKTLDELRSLIVVPEHCQSLVEYLRAFEYTIAVSQTEYALTRIMHEVCEDAVLDGVSYLEVRFAPNLHTMNGLTPSKVLESVILGARMAEQAFKGFHARIIVCGIRSDDVSVVNDMARVAVQYKNQGVVAFDIAGPELGFVPSKFKDAFSLVHEELLSSTIHAGEAADHQYVHEALHVCRAMRIGHGVNMKNDPSLIQFAFERQIPIEMCLTSNLQTKAVSHYSEHPLPDFFRRGLMVVPCTDNTLMSNITLSQEYMKIQELFLFNKTELLQLVDNSFRAAFTHDELKQELREKAQQVAKELLFDHAVL